MAKVTRTDEQIWLFGETKCEQAGGSHVAAYSCREAMIADMCQSLDDAEEEGRLDEGLYKNTDRTDPDDIEATLNTTGCSYAWWGPVPVMALK